MISVIEQGYNKPNLGSGKGVTGKEIAEAIAVNLPDECKIVWDTSNRLVIKSE